MKKQTHCEKFVTRDQAIDLITNGSFVKEEVLSGAAMLKRKTFHVIVDHKDYLVNVLYYNNMLLDDACLLVPAKKSVKRSYCWTEKS